MSRSRGFALLAVLWVTVALGALAAGAVAQARLDASATGERILAMRARWAAEGCLAASLGLLDSALGQRAALAPPPADTLHYANGTSCVTSAADPSERLDSPYSDGRLNLSAASEGALSALPGIGPEALRVIADARAWQRPLTGLDDLVRRLTPQARELLLAHYSELTGLTSFSPAALVLTVRGWLPSARTTATIEVLVVGAGARAAVVRRRMW